MFVCIYFLQLPVYFNGFLWGHGELLAVFTGGYFSFTKTMTSIDEG